MPIFLKQATGSAAERARISKVIILVIFVTEDNEILESIESRKEYGYSSLFFEDVRLELGAVERLSRENDYQLGKIEFRLEKLIQLQDHLRDELVAITVKFNGKYYFGAPFLELIKSVRKSHLEKPSLDSEEAEVGYDWGCNYE